MFLGRMVGNIWATQKDARLSALKLLIVRPYGWYCPSHDSDHVVAVDALDAGVGDDVVVTFGAPARWRLGGKNFPVEAAVAAIVDSTEVAPEAWTLADAPFRFTPGPLPAGVTNPAVAEADEARGTLDITSTVGEEETSGHTPRAPTSRAGEDTP